MKQKVFNKKSSQAVARPTLPSKPVKWKPRDNIAKFGIIYKFLTDGVDAEDIMYLKRSYELVRSNLFNFEVTFLITLILLAAERRTESASTAVDQRHPLGGSSHYQ